MNDVINFESAWKMVRSGELGFGQRVEYSDSANGNWGLMAGGFIGLNPKHQTIVVEYKIVTCHYADVLFIRKIQ